MRQVGIFISLLFSAGILLIPSAKAADVECKKGEPSEIMLFSKISHNKTGEITFSGIRKPGELLESRDHFPFFRRNDINPNEIYLNIPFCANRRISISP